MEQAQTYRKIKDRLADRNWRLNNLYYITDKSGKKIRFRMNWAQRWLYKNLWYYNVILKARQLGFTTFILIYFLDACLFNSNHSAGVIAHNLEDAKKLFKEKVKFAYDNLPQWLKDERPTTGDSARTLEFTNGSSFYVGTSLRSGTMQKLLVSEYGKISAKYPDKAKEVKTGALNTIEAGQQIFVESTAEGKVGEFFDLIRLARNLVDSGKRLARLEPKFFFFPWFKNPEYSATQEETENTVLTEDQEKYFAALEDLGISLTSEQKAWYAIKEAQQGEDMRQEYPSTPDEAFEGSMEGAFYTEEMRHLRKAGAIRVVPYNPKYQVYTFWDLGKSAAMMVIVFAQYINGQWFIIDYHESNSQGWDFYAEVIKSKDYNYAKHFLPHDGQTRIVGRQVYTSKQLAEQVGISPVFVVTRTKNVWDDIRNHCKPFLKQVVICQSKAARLVEHLDNYRRRYDQTNSVWLNEPQADESAHGADGFRTMVMAIENKQIFDKKPPARTREVRHRRSSSTSWMA